MAPTRPADGPAEVSHDGAAPPLLWAAATELLGEDVTVAVGKGIPRELTCAGLRRSEEGGIGKTELLDSLQSVHENISACGQLKSCHPVCGESDTSRQSRFPFPQPQTLWRLDLLSLHS